MADNWFLGVIMIFFLLKLQDKVKSQNVVKRSPDPTYVTLGDTLVLNVTYDITGHVGVAWSNSSGKSLYLREITGGVLNLDKRASLEGQATLIIKNTALYDNGTYTVQVTSLTTTLQRKTFDVIIQVQPTATLNDSNTIIVPEHSDVYSSCEGINGVPTSTVSWYKGKKLVVKRKTLPLMNIKKEQGGSYTCKVQSGTLTDETVLEIIVLFKPNIMAIESDPKIAIIGNKLEITCKADGVPKPSYIIYHNGTKIFTGAKDKVEVTKSATHSHAGNYTCTARNFLGIDTRSFNLSVKDEPTGQPTSKLTTSISPKSSETSNTTEKSKCADSTGFEWYIILVTLICGIIIGMILLYAIQSLRRRFKSKKDVSKPAHNYDTPETHPESAADNSAYQELDLRNKESENSYQALRMNTRRRINNETKIEDEAGYQELDKVREKDNNYQSLNRV